MSDAALLAVSPPRLFLPSGTVLEGRYRVERFVGQGATGCVFLATHLGSGEGLALKLVHPVDPGRRPGAAAGFLVAARAASRFRSENVAHVRDMGTLEDGSPYLVMDYLEGETLERHLRVQPVPLPIARAVDIALQAARGLDDAHAAGLVHRNARPSKWFLTRTPDSPTCVKILDFGASKITPRGGGADESRSTGSGPVGDLAYAAPEQRDAPAAVDARADVWTVGVVLHELLARAPPFRGESVREARIRALATAPPALRARRSELAPELEAVVVRCLERDPEARFGTMAELMLALAPFHGAWERSSITPTPPPARAAPLASTRAPAAPVPEPVLPPLPRAIARAVARAAGTTPEPVLAPAASPETPLVASVSSVIVPPGPTVSRAAPLRRAKGPGAWIRSPPRMAIAIAIGVLLGVAGHVLLRSRGPDKPAANLAPPDLGQAAASTPAPPAPSEPSAVAATVATEATAAAAEAPATPATGPRATKTAPRSPATKALSTGTAAAAPVGTAGFGDRQ